MTFIAILNQNENPNLQQFKLKLLPEDKESRPSYCLLIARGGFTFFVGVCGLVIILVVLCDLVGGINLKRGNYNVNVSFFRSPDCSGMSTINLI